jgi:hypothetical protein
MATDTRTKAELLEALKAKEKENKELSDNLESALDRLTETEKAKQTGRKSTSINTKEKGVVIFRGHGVNHKGKVYTDQDLKKPENHEVLYALIENGSELVTSKS